MTLFPRHNLAAAQSIGPDPSYLLMWAFNGRLRMFATRTDITLTCAELDQDATLEPGLSATPPREDAPIEPDLSFKTGIEATFSILFRENEFNADAVLEDSPAELSIVWDGIDLAERIVLVRGAAEGVLWPLRGKQVSATIKTDAVEDNGQCPDKAVGSRTWDNVWDEWGGGLYPVVFGTGLVTRIKCVVADAYTVGTPPLTTTRFFKFVVCDDWPFPESATVVVERFNEEYKEFEEVTGDFLYQSDNTTTGGGLIRTTDDAGNRVTCLYVKASITIENVRAQATIYATVTWTARASDTLSNAMDTLLRKYGQLSVPVDITSLSDIDAESGNPAFEIIVNAQTTALKVVGDRILKQTASGLRFYRDALAVWSLPRSLRAAGPVLSETESEITAIETEPESTALSDLVNTWHLRYVRNMTPKSAGGEDYLETIFYQPEGTVARMIPMAYARTFAGDPASSQSSRIAYGPRRFELDCPDLVREEDVLRLAARMARWFSEPQWRIGVRLDPRWLWLRVGMPVRITLPDYGFAEAPFIVESFLPDINGPQATLWGGRELL